MIKYFIGYYNEPKTLKPINDIDPVTLSTLHKTFNNLKHHQQFIVRIDGHLKTTIFYAKTDIKSHYHAQIVQADLMTFDHDLKHHIYHMDIIASIYRLLGREIAERVKRNLLIRHIIRKDSDFAKYVAWMPVSKALNTVFESSNWQAITRQSTLGHNYTYYLTAGIYDGIVNTILGNADKTYPKFTEDVGKQLKLRDKELTLLGLHDIYGQDEPDPAFRNPSPQLAQLMVLFLLYEFIVRLFLYNAGASYTQLSALEWDKSSNGIALQDNNNDGKPDDILLKRYNRHRNKSAHSANNIELDSYLLIDFKQKLLDQAQDILKDLKNEQDHGSIKASYYIAPYDSQQITQISRLLACELNSYSLLQAYQLVLQRLKLGLMHDDLDRDLTNIFKRS